MEYKFNGEFSRIMEEIPVKEIDYGAMYEKQPRTIRNDRIDVMRCAAEYLGLWKEQKMRIERVIFNDPATIIIWKDGTKTIVKCSDDDTYDEEKGLAMCFMKKFYGNDNSFHKIFKEHCPSSKEG